MFHYGPQELSTDKGISRGSRFLPDLLAKPLSETIKWGEWESMVWGEEHKKTF
jgi:hypothetical protein